MGKTRSGVKLKFLFLFLLSILLVYLGSSVGCYAASFQTPSLLDNKYEIIKNTDNYSPDISSYPFNEDNVNAVGFTTLFGENKSLIQYLGEIPSIYENEEELKKLRTMGGTTIDGETRNWSTNPGFDASEITPDSEELHLKAMVYTAGGGIFYVLYIILKGLNFLTSLPLSLVMLIKSIDFNYILDTFDKNGNVSELFNKLFLISNDGDVSPFLILMLVLFIISLCGVIIKALKGDKAFSEVRREIAYFLLAACVTGICLGSNTKSELAKWSVNLAGELGNGIAIAADDSFGLYEFDTSNTTRDIEETQKSLLNKIYVDLNIKMQFGYDVDDLTIKETDGTYTDNFGKDVEKAIQQTFSNGGDFTVSNGKTTINNLGYYLYSANSNVNNSTPLNDDGVNSASNYRILYVVDFLENARKLAESNGETDIVNKINTIMKNIYAPDYSSGLLSLFLYSLLNLSLTFALFMTVIFMSIGKIIVSIGMFAIPVIAPLILVDKSRPLAKKLFLTYIMGFVRYIVGLLLYTFILTLSIMVSSGGTFGIIIATILCFIVGKLAPKILLELNRMISIREANFMQPVSAGFNKYANKVTQNRVNKKQNAIRMNKDGLLEKQDLSFYSRLSRGTGLRNDKPLFENDEDEDKKLDNDNQDDIEDKSKDDSDKDKDKLSNSGLSDDQIDNLKDDEDKDKEDEEDEEKENKNTDNEDNKSNDSNSDKKEKNNIKLKIKRNIANTGLKIAQETIIGNNIVNTIYENQKKSNKQIKSRDNTKDKNQDKENNKS